MPDKKDQFIADLESAALEVVAVQTLEQAIEFIKAESRSMPDKFIFLIIGHDEALDDPTAKPKFNGKLFPIVVDNEEDLKDMLAERPINGMYEIYKNGELYDTSAKFENGGLH